VAAQGHDVPCNHQSTMKCYSIIKGFENEVEQQAKAIKAEAG
jgi:hypothetical protein